MIAGALVTAKAILAKVPAIAWVILGTILLIVVGWLAAVHIGERRGAVRVERATVAAAIVHVQGKRDTARAKSDAIGKVAVKAKTASDTGRAHTRAVIAAHLAETPPEVVQAVNAQLERDSVTIAVHVAEVATLRAERPIDDKLDSLRVHQVEIGAPEPDHHTTAKIVGGVIAGAAAVLTLVHFAK
jgi:hypothetical protein